MQRYLDMDSDSFEQLVDLMAEQLIRKREAAVHCRSPDDCPLHPQALAGTEQQEFAALLGPDASQLLCSCQDSLSERAGVTQFRGRLSDANHLTDQQTESLVAALAERLNVIHCAPQGLAEKMSGQPR